MRSADFSTASGIDARARLRLVAAGAALAVAMVAGPVSAAHTDGTLDCGSAGTYAVQAASSAPQRFEAPVPWSGLFLLEGTNQVFRALTIETPRWSIALPAADHTPRSIVSCTLTSSGLNFETPWVLTGFLAP